MTMGKVGAGVWPGQWLSDGWAALRDKAHYALTYFKQEEHDVEDQAEQAIAPPRWGLLATDVIDYDDRLELHLEIPGMVKDNLTVEIEGGQIVVAGVKRSEKTTKSGNAIMTERAFGQFRRVLPLPVDVDADSAKARYVDGILVVDLPKQSQRQPRSVHIG